MRSVSRLWNKLPKLSKKQKILLAILIVFIIITSIPIVRSGNKAFEHENYYKSLNLDPAKYSTYSKQDIKKAYRNIARRYFPDKARSDEEREISRMIHEKSSEAYHVLTDDELRSIYDLSLDPTFGEGETGAYLAVQEKMKKM